MSGAATWDLAWHRCRCGKPIFEDHDELCDWCRADEALKGQTK